MATHSSVPAREIPWTEEPGGLQFMGLQRVTHNLVTKKKQKTKKTMIITFPLIQISHGSDLLAVILKHKMSSESP